VTKSEKNEKIIKKIQNKEQKPTTPYRKTDKKSRPYGQHVHATAEIVNSFIKSPSGRPKNETKSIGRDSEKPLGNYFSGPQRQREA